MGSSPLIIGHRGASRDAPENTLAAFRLAWEQGADGIEADFRLTGDERIVCLHDASTVRTTGVDLSVEASDLADLCRLDAGKWKGKQWAGERIPTLAEVIDSLPPGKRLFIELKSGPEIVDRLAGALAGADLVSGQVVLLSFSALLVGLLKERLPSFRAHWLCDPGRSWSLPGRTPTVEELLATLRDSGADGLACRTGGHLDQRLTTSLIDAGFELHVWTVDSVTAARRYAALGAASIFTNRPGWLREQLERDDKRELRSQP